MPFYPLSLCRGNAGMERSSKRSGAALRSATEAARGARFVVVAYPTLCERVFCGGSGANRDKPSGGAAETLLVLSVSGRRSRRAGQRSPSEKTWALVLGKLERRKAA